MTMMPTRPPLVTCPVCGEPANAVTEEVTTRLLCEPNPRPELPPGTTFRTYHPCGCEV